MGLSLTYKILGQNLLKGELRPGEEICVKGHQTLTQDSTGTMAYLQLNAMNVDKVKNILGKDKFLSVGEGMKDMFEYVKEELKNKE